jgi:hypothetical protein
VAAAYLRLAPEAVDKEPYRSLGIRPEAEPNGTFVMPYAGLLAHRRDDWLVHYGWLRSDKEYSDFILRLEFRFLKPRQDGGVFLRAGIEGKDWPDRKYEVKVENTARMAKIFNAQNDLNVELVRKVLKPDGEWNEYCIKIVGPRIEVRLNGELVSTSDSADQLERDSFSP